MEEGPIDGRRGRLSAVSGTMADDLNDSLEEVDRLKREVEDLRAGLLSVEAERRRLAAPAERHGEEACER